MQLAGRRCFARTTSFSTFLRRKRHHTDSKIVSPLSLLREGIHEVTLEQFLKYYNADRVNHKIDTEKDGNTPQSMQSSEGAALAPKSLNQCVVAYRFYLRPI